MTMNNNFKTKIVNNSSNDSYKNKNSFKIITMSNIKKILMSLTITAISSTAFASNNMTHTNYFKGTYGSVFRGPKIADNRLGQNDQNKQIMGVAGSFGMGHMFREKMGFELLLEFSYPSVRIKDMLRDYPTPGDYKNVMICQKNTTVGGKFVTSFPVRYGINATTATGVGFTSIMAGYHGEFATPQDPNKFQDTVANTVTKITPFGMLGIGADVTASEGILAGIEYSFKFHKNEELQRETIYGLNAMTGTYSHTVMTTLKLII